MTLSQAEVNALPTVQALKDRVEFLEKQLENVEALKNANQINYEKVEELKRKLEESKTLLQAQQEQISSAQAGTKSGIPVAAVGTLLTIAWLDDKYEQLELHVRINGQTIYNVTPKSTFTGSDAKADASAEVETAEETEEENVQNELDVSSENSEEPLPEEEDAETKPPELPAEPGDAVLVSLQSMQVVGPANNTPLFGAICTVKRIVDDEGNNVEVEQGGSAVIVASGKFKGQIVADDRVVLDQSSSIVMANLGKGEKDFFEPEESPVSFDDIGGLEDAKLDLLE